MTEQDKRDGMAFLAAIRAGDRDPSTVCGYADWLTEHSDERVYIWDNGEGYSDFAILFLTAPGLEPQDVIKAARLHAECRGGNSRIVLVATCAEVYDAEIYDLSTAIEIANFIMYRSQGSGLSGRFAPAPRQGAVMKFADRCPIAVLRYLIAKWEEYLEKTKPAPSADSWKRSRYTSLTDTLSLFRERIAYREASTALASLSE